ncbi:hypothetical protein DOTSEDRAFT_74480 [Dothistroma septosporum NZE10]|uniref:Alkaline phytoceramidase n=1 Tax=Dothistroma septosporum (strain NZE10 / CBS 128990) TaxID=675120 RepID=N1PFQ1_DOTSN|nr:hypothetical protein DOTSEDRAFT_74480 [Dothistroma septosporum NZE10]
MPSRSSTVCADTVVPGSFCEEDYAVTYYIAEFFNTLTSLAYIAYGIHGIRRYKRQGLGLFAEPNLSYWALIGVGIFSGGYHMTLKYYTQMSDELSMHLSIGTLLHQVYTFNEPPNIQRRNTAIIVGVLVPFVIYHCVTDEFLMHVILFFIMSWMVAFRTRKLIRETVKDQGHRRQLRRLVSVASWTSMAAYGIWNIDVHFCPQVHHLKQQVGMPWAVLLELHGYWHIMTAIGAYTFMAIIEFLLSPANLDSHGFGFAWPAKAVLRDISSHAVTPNGHADGQLNGGVRKDE